MTDAVLPGIPAEQAGAKAQIKEGDEPHRIRRRPVLVATIMCAVAAGVGHLLLWIGYTGDLMVGDRPLVPWQPVIGMVLSIVAIVSFGAFYLASRLPRMAIAASFLLTFLVFFTFALTIAAIEPGDRTTAANLVDDLRKVVNVIVWWYFGSETVISGLKVYGVARGADPEAVRAADRVPDQNP